MKTYELKSNKNKLDAIVGVAATGNDLKESVHWVDSAALAILHVPDGFTPAQGRQGTVFVRHPSHPPMIGAILRDAATRFIRGECVAFARTDVAFETDLRHIHDYIEKHGLGRTWVIGTADFIILSNAVVKAVANSGELDFIPATDLVSAITKVAKTRVGHNRYHSGVYLNIGYPKVYAEATEPAPFSFSESVAEEYGFGDRVHVETTASNASTVTVSVDASEKSSTKAKRGRKPRKVVK